MHRKRAFLAALAGTALIVVSTVVVTQSSSLAWWWKLRREFDPRGVNVLGYREFRHRNTGIVFVELPGGMFTMGCSADEDGCNDYERPQHVVTVGPFLIGKYEVKRDEWTEATGVTSSLDEEEDLPVDHISWEDCARFCEAHGFSLPTEAEWEYACRAGTQTRFSSGDRSEDLAVIGWYRGNSGGVLHPVGRKDSNAFGLHDMHGNVWEWCADAFDPGFYSSAASSQDNPVCSGGSQDRVIRGGCFDCDATTCRSALRRALPMSDSTSVVGFRLVFRR